MTEADPFGLRPAPQLSGVALAAAFLALFAFSLWSRWPLVVEGLWRDEAAAVYVARSASVSEFLARHRATEYTPPLFNTLVALYGRLFGFDERALKVFAFGLGFLALGGIAALSGQLFGRWAALGACVLASNNPILLGLSAELRPYSLSIALASASLILVWRLRRTGEAAGWRRGVLLAACLALLAYSHIAGALAALAIGAIGLHALTRRDSRAFGRTLVGAAGAAGAAFCSWLPMAWSQFRAGLPYETPLGTAARWRLLASRIPAVLPDFGGGFVLLLAGGLVAVASFGSRAVRARLRALAPRFALLLGPAIVVLLLLGLFSRADRYLAVPAALLAVAAAGLLDAVLRSGPAHGGYGRALGGIILAAVLAGSVVARAPFYRDIRLLARREIPKSGVRTLCRELAPGEGEFLMAVPDYLATTLWYYCGPKPALRGVALWQDALLLDWRAYSSAWASPRLVPGAVERVARQIESQRPARFILVRDATAPLGTPLGFPARIKALRRALESRYAPGRESVHRGRIENIEATEFHLEGPQ